MPYPAPTLEKELALFKAGFKFIAGLDEVGRGAWAGPVVAAAVILPLDLSNPSEQWTGVRDSKQMTCRQREKLFDLIKAKALSVGLGLSSSAEVDQYRIVEATRLAMQRAVAQLDPAPHHLLIDALTLPQLSLPQLAFPKADAISLSVAAAAIVAKVTRDHLMICQDEAYPGYHFAQHKGYGTKAHLASLKTLGPCPIHRYSFAPIQALVENDALGNSE